MTSFRGIKTRQRYRELPDRFFSPVQPTPLRGEVRLVHFNEELARDMGLSLESPQDWVDIGAGRALLGLAAAVVPFATVPFERWAQRKGLLADAWRLRREPGAGPLERLVGWALRNPVLAVVAAVAAVAVVFTILLLVGPPF